MKRNAARFPEDFLFQLTQSEKEQVVTICDHLARLKFSKSWWVGLARRADLRVFVKKTGPPVFVLPTVLGCPPQ